MKNNSGEKRSESKRAKEERFMNIRTRYLMGPAGIEPAIYSV